MEFIGKKTIKTDKIINELDKFVLKFVKILEKFAKYAIVSGYVSIFFGRSRATEDVDVIVETLDKETFTKLYSKLIKNGFWCINSGNINELYDYLQEHAVRFAKKNNSIPNIEFKFAKGLSDFESLKDQISIETSKGKLFMGNIELQIAYKRIVLCSEKDLEDAMHLEEVFKENLNKEKILSYSKWLKQ